MAKAGRKTLEMKQFSFRLPADVYQDYLTVAQARGVDLSAVLNWVLAEFRPALLLRHAQHMAAMLRAGAAGLPQGEVPSSDSQALLGIAKAVMEQIQEMATKLAEQPHEGARREAG